jgi:glycine/D-amino acid oxidase-like deaminating enzyme
LLAGRIVAALAHWLSANGQRVEAGQAVTAVDPAAATLRVGDETLSFDRVLVAAGPWSNKLLPHLAPRMTPSRQVVVYLAPPAAHAAAWADAPMLLDIGRDAGLYAVPPRIWHGQSLGLKVGDHNFAVGADPDAPRVATPAEIERVTGLAGRRFRDLADYAVVQAKVCFYDMAAAERFIVEPLGPRAWVMTGFSGHGFKFGAVLGQRVAAALVGEADVPSVIEWAAGR